MAGSLESLIATSPRISATSTHSPFPVLWLDLRQLEHCFFSSIGHCHFSLFSIQYTPMPARCPSC